MIHLAGKISSRRSATSGVGLGSGKRSKEEGCFDHHGDQQHNSDHEREGDHHNGGQTWNEKRGHWKE